MPQRDSILPSARARSRPRRLEAKTAWAATGTKPAAPPELARNRTQRRALARRLLQQDTAGGPALAEIRARVPVVFKNRSLTG